MGIFNVLTHLIGAIPSGIYVQASLRVDIKVIHHCICCVANIERLGINIIHTILHYPFLGRKAKLLTNKYYSSELFLSYLERTICNSHT